MVLQIVILRYQQIVDNLADEENNMLGKVVNNKGVAIENNGGELIIGEITENDTVQTISPIIQGATNSIVNKVRTETTTFNPKVSFYDGKIIGAMKDVTFENIPEGYELDKSVSNQITLKKSE